MTGKYIIYPKHHFGDTITYYNDQYEALIEADCLAVLTEWPEFKIPNFNIVNKLLNTAAIFDGRNIYDTDEMKKLGFDYFCIGVNTLTHLKNKPLRSVS